MESPAYRARDFRQMAAEAPTESSEKPMTEQRITGQRTWVR
jgi:hypothetical protein